MSRVKIFGVSTCVAPLWPSARDLRGQGTVLGRVGGWVWGDPTERQEQTAKITAKYGPQNLNLTSFEFEMCQRESVLKKTSFYSFCSMGGITFH